MKKEEKVVIFSIMPILTKGRNIATKVLGHQTKREGVKKNCRELNMKPGTTILIFNDDKCIDA